MLEDLIIWVLVAGVALIILSGVLLVINVMNNKSSLIASITLVAFAIFFSFVGMAAIGAFIVVALLDAFVDIAASSFIVASGISTIIGTLVGGGIAIKYHSKQRESCQADPNCNLY